MKKKLLILGLVAALTLTSCKKVPLNVERVRIAGQNITLQPKDVLTARGWEGDIQVTLNNKEYKKFPVLYNGVTLNSKLDDTLKAFDIEKGYALLSREVSACIWV